MRYYRCQCGHRAAWSSMGVARCEGCEKCGMTLAEAPDGHATPEPHDWREEFTVDAATGARAKERVCLFCQKREPVVFTVYFNGVPVQLRAIDITGGQLLAMAMGPASVDITDSLLREATQNPVGFDERIEISDGMRFVAHPTGDAKT